MCQANILTCNAEEFDCRCGIIACTLHGHVDEGDNEGWENCPNLIPDGVVSVTPDLSHVAPQFVETGLPCHLRHRWGILPEEWIHGERRGGAASE